MKKKTVSFTDARMSLRENKTHKSIHIWSYSLYERVISVQVKKQGWLTSFHQCRTDLVDSRNNLSSNSLFNWLYTQLHYFLNLSQLPVSCLPFLATL